MHTYGKLDRKELEVEFSRIVAFSDGVFAIAITLLVLSFEVPGSGAQLEQGLEKQLPDLLAFVLSFAVLARVWVFHHRLFGALDQFDGRLIALNFLYLAFIILVPFTSDLIGEYGNERIAAIIYAVNMGVVGLVGAVMLEYAFRAELVRPALLERRFYYVGPPAWVLPVAFFGSIPVAFLDVQAAEVMWLIVFVLGGLLSSALARRPASD
jgi:uncharacterized membrane protein